MSIVLGEKKLVVAALKESGGFCTNKKFPLHINFADAITLRNVIHAVNRPFGRFVYHYVQTVVLIPATRILPFPLRRCRSNFSKSTLQKLL